MIGVSSADDDLQSGVNLPEAANGFQAIPSRWHPHIDEGHRVRLICCQGLFYLGKGFLALKRGFQFEGEARELWFRSPEESLRFLIDGRSGRIVCHQDLAEVLVDGRVVVNDENASIEWQGVVHAASWLTAAGNSTVKVAPLPGPSLWTLRLPFISLAASAPECSPNPCPSFLVVKPWRKMFVRFSCEIPMPLSA